LSKGKIQSYAVGPDYVSAPTSGQYAALGAVLVPNKAAMAKLVSAFIRGDPPPGQGTPTPSSP
jgi:hypothetical protein